MEIRASCRGRSRRHRVLLLTTVSLLLAGCGMPDSMHVRKGSDPKYEDDNVRFRTTYYFRVFDLCEGLTQMQQPREKLLFDSAQRGPYYLKTDSLYRFVMTGKANALGNDIHFESGTLRKEQIDPFGTAVRYNQSSGSFLIENQTELKARAKQAETVTRIRELVALRAELAKIDGSNATIDAIVKQHLDDLAPSGKAESLNSPTTAAVQTGQAKNLAAMSDAIFVRIDDITNSDKKLEKAISAAEAALTKALTQEAAMIGQSASALLEPGQSIFAAQNLLAGKIIPFFDRIDQNVRDSSTIKDQKDTALAVAKSAEQNAATDLAEEEKLKLTTIRQQAESEARAAANDETAAKNRQTQLAATATAARAAQANLATIVTTAPQSLSPAFRSTLLAQMNAAGGATPAAATLLGTLNGAKANDFMLPPKTLDTALQQAQAAIKSMQPAPADAGEKQAKVDLEALANAIAAAQNQRQPYADTLNRLAGIAAILVTVRGANDTLGSAAMHAGAATLKSQVPKTQAALSRAKATAYIDALTQRIALHNISITSANPAGTLSTVDTAMDNAGRDFRMAVDTLNTDAKTAFDSATALRLKTTGVAGEIAKLSPLPDGSDPALATALAAVSAESTRLTALAESTVSDLALLLQQSASLRQIAGRHPEVKAVANETPAGNIRCDNGLSARRGFQVLGPEGFRTFDQDERLIMAMSSNAKPLIGTLTDVSNRMINARKGTVDTGRQIADERRRAGRARDVLDTFTVIGKDSSYSASELAKRVSAAFDETSDKQRK